MTAQATTTCFGCEQVVAESQFSLMVVEAAAEVHISHLTTLTNCLR
jgi:hypothetical protein